MSDALNDSLSDRPIRPQRHLTHLLPAKSITRGPRHHFFGYYDKCPWDVTGRYMLCLETDFADRPVNGTQAARVMLVDLYHPAGPSLTLLDETLAWCWQQGNMLQWMNGSKREVIYNALNDGAFVSVVRDIHTRASRVLPLPIYTLCPKGSIAASLNFARLGERRPGYGYPALPDPYRDELTPAGDGIRMMNLTTGSHELIVSLQQIVAQFPQGVDQQTHHWFNHLQFNTDGSLLAFMHRWAIGPNRRRTRLFTVRPDGSELKLLCDWPIFSHYDWLSPTQLVAFAQHPARGYGYYLFEVGSSRVHVIGEGLYDRDGHCRFSPDKQWMLTDTYRDASGHQTLILHHLASDQRIDIGRLLTPALSPSELRCDLHGRWSRDGSQICVDTMRDGTRQLAVVDVTPVTQAFSSVPHDWQALLPICSLDASSVIQG